MITHIESTGKTHKIKNMGRNMLLWLMVALIYLRVLATTDLTA